MDINNFVQQFQTIAEKYRGLSLVQRETGYFIEGKISFDRSYNNISFQDEYSIEISTNGPQNKLPKIKEIGNRIKREIDNHIYDDGVLCLGNELDCYERCQNSLLIYLSDLVVPFLYANSYKEKYGKYPWEQLLHRNDGRIQYYTERFTLSVSELMTLIGNISIMDQTKGHHQCLCGQNKRYRDCCRKNLLAIKEDPIKFKIFLNDIEYIRKDINLAQKRNAFIKNSLDFKRK